VGGLEQVVLRVFPLTLGILSCFAVEVKIFLGGSQHPEGKRAAKR
jgi:hypothetical protein